ncbi:NADH:flavin oxidoreductase [Winogradskyella bathintestinalis]|uniref:NADH:flavin oxidoreductase n=1 Tax=Winogradskyella bathintestinalis TaxID=3035208 RepID=A0ABT7ZU53_9FLAO|nr:NADH:flavin oxidoreductase [Winogradskyella bathintestinalis]MDN3492506.1 NADH:flavin oxidoreductase [Winogradskyella bathintestinalis]
MKYNLDDSVTFNCGAKLKNRFMLAPLTNRQSHENGQLSEDEFRWLTMRAKGQFGLVMTCASHVQKIGKGFSGQLGIFSDDLIPGHTKLTKAIKEEGSLAVIQLHHAGMRSPKEVIEQKAVCPSENKEHNARALTLEEIYQLKEDFVDAAIRAKRSGYDGVEVHGAHGYILTQFLSSDINKRTDKYGGSLENRSRLLFEIINEIRIQCGPEFLLGVRLSPERFAMKLSEIKIVSQQLIDSNHIDFLDLSLWDCFKTPEEYPESPLNILEHILQLDYKNVKLTVAGKIGTGNEVLKVLDLGVDFVTIGRSAILHHDFPKKVMENHNFNPIDTPVSAQYLKNEGLSDTFITYMQRWDGFVEDKN